MFDNAGRRLWSFRPELPEGTIARLIPAAGDLNGDGQPEFCLAVQTYRLRKTGARMWAQENVRSHLLVLDRAGRVLTQRPLESDVQLLHVAAPSTGVGPARLLCLVEGRLLSFSLGPGSSSGAEA